MTDLHSEEFGNVPNASDNFGTIPQDAESFRTIRNSAERTDRHTLTVREVARLFEEAGVARTERSIINWCQPNRQGVARLDAFFDTNERRYYITRQSVSQAIEEERSRRSVTAAHAEAEAKSDAIPKRAESEADDDSLRSKVRDLEITNRVKDQFITMLEGDRKRLMDEREQYVRELMAQSRQIGELETRLVQIPASLVERLPHLSEKHGNLTATESPDAEAKPSGDQTAETSSFQSSAV